MATINFPDSPTIGDIFTFVDDYGNTRLWQWDGTTWRTYSN